MTDKPITLDDNPEVIVTARGGRLLPFSATPPGRGVPPPGPPGRLARPQRGACPAERTAAPR